MAISLLNLLLHNKWKIFLGWFNHVKSGPFTKVHNAKGNISFTRCVSVFKTLPTIY